jgi:hypothetical protein
MMINILSQAKTLASLIRRMKQIRCLPMLGSGVGTVDARVGTHTQLGIEMIIVKAWHAPMGP